jgi:hypothetical protein
MGVRVEVVTKRGLAIGILTVFMLSTFLPWGITNTSVPILKSEVSVDVLEDLMIVADDSALLNFSSYIGGNSDDEYVSVDCDEQGNIYVALATYSRDLPLVNPIDDTYDGHGSEGYIIKINPNGTIIYSSYIGGFSTDEIYDIFVDDAGFVYLTGMTNSEDFPIVNAADSTLDGANAFVCKINQAGTAFVYSTFVGGSGSEIPRRIWVNDSGQAYIVGQTWSLDFPTRNPFDGSLEGDNDCFVAKLSSGGNSLLYSTLIGGSGWEEALGVVVDTEGAIYVTGYTNSPDFPTVNALDGTTGGDDDCFVAKINPSGTSLNYSTFLGGNSIDHGNAIGIDSLGRAYVVGSTYSTDFPTARPLDNTYSGSTDAFITVLNPDGQTMNFSTYLGTSGVEEPTDLVVTSIGSLYVCGTSNSFPAVIRESYDSGFNGGADVFVFRMNTDQREIILGTYIGGETLELANSLAVGNDGRMYVCGRTFSTNLPLLNQIDSTYDPGGQQGFDTFVSVISDSSDWDLDGIRDAVEFELGTDRLNPDSDFDLLGDYLEVYQLGTNPLSNCTFGNGTLDGDLDHDGDMLTNVEELYEYHTDLLNPDCDLDLLEDGFEVHVVGSLPTEFDSDFDFLSDWEEYVVYGTDCLAPDSDQDLMEDYYEVHNGLNPLLDDASFDEDGDLLTNYQEYLIGTSANNTDSDLDMMPDSWEYINGLDPLEDDSLLDYDTDQLSNLAEFQNGCDPRNRDCDQDSLYDGYEVLVLGTNPLSNDSDTDSIPDPWEVEYGLNPLFDDSGQDLDADDLTNLAEYQIGTRPDMADTDLDSYLDAWEVKYGFDPTNPKVSLAQTIFSNLHFLIAGIGVELVTIPVLYRRVQQKHKKTKQEEQLYQEQVSKQLKELVDPVDDSSDSAD